MPSVGHHLLANNQLPMPWRAGCRELEGAACARNLKKVSKW